MSATDPERPRLRSAADWTVRLGLPLAVLAVVLAVFVTERAGVSHELAIVAPPSAAPGGRIPVRALIFDLSREGGPTLIAAPVRVTLRDGDRVVAETTLEPSIAGGADGHLALPGDLAADHLTLEGAVTVGSEGAATVRRALAIVADPPDAERTGRMALAMQHFEPGPIEPIGDGVLPSPLAVRIVGGACVPESECELLVHVGAPGAAVRVAPNAALDVRPPSESGETTGIVRLPVVVHGPEAHAVLEASRDGVVVARRALRLPVALATPAVSLPERIVASDRAPAIDVEVLGDRPGVIVDAYRHGRWRRTGAMPPSDAAVPSPTGALDPGLWQLQVRTDPFSAERAAVRMVLSGDDIDGAFAEIARLGGDPTAPQGPPALRLAWAAASVEMGLRVLPPSVSGHEEDLARLRARQRTLRLAAVAALLLGLVVAAVVLLRRGVESALEAQRVMEATGDPDLKSARHRRRTLLSALAIVATVLLAFVGAAALIVARAHLLE